MMIGLCLVFDLLGFEFLLTYLFHPFGSRRQDALGMPGPFCGFDPSEFTEQRRHVNLIFTVLRRHSRPRSSRPSWDGRVARTGVHLYRSSLWFGVAFFTLGHPYARATAVTADLLAG